MNLLRRCRYVAPVAVNKAGNSAGGQNHLVSNNTCSPAHLQPSTPASQNRLVHRRLLPPAEMSADNPLHNQVIGPCSSPNPYTKIDLPLRRNVQVSHCK